MVYSTDRSKAVVPVLVLLFDALWFILRGDLLYVFPCVILFLCFSVLLVLRLPHLGKRELILVLFVRLFDLCLFGFVGFLLGSGKGCGLWLWHSLDFSLFFSNAQGHVTPKGIIRFSPKSNLIEILCPSLLSARIKPIKIKLKPYGDDSFSCCLWELYIYVAMATRIPIWSAQKPYAAFPPAQWCYTWNLIKIAK